MRGAMRNSGFCVFEVSWSYMSFHIIQHGSFYDEHTIKIKQSKGKTRICSEIVIHRIHINLSIDIHYKTENAGNQSVCIVFNNRDSVATHEQPTSTW